MIDIIASAIAGGYDLKTKTIPNFITIPLIMLGILIAENNFKLTLIVSLIALTMVYANFMGMGDAKMFIGLSLAAPALFFFMLIGTWLSSIPTALYTALKKDFNTKRPFAQHICIGVIFSHIVILI